VRRLGFVVVVFLLASAAGAHAAADLLVGVTEDGLKTEPEAALADARKLGLGAFRITLRWRPGLTEPTEEQAAELERATRGASRIEIVLSVYGERAAHAPTTQVRQDAYCGFLAEIVRRYKRIRNVAIWNEPNKTFFWSPQFNPDGSSAAPVAYAELLGRCWDVLHDARSDVKVIAPSTSPRGNDNPEAASNVSHSPTKFVRELGRAYRESGRDTPLFDVVGHHVHALHSAERPWRAHPGTGITQGDLAKLERTLADAFAGTRQPVPGRCIEGRCVPIWWLEVGFQTKPDPAKASLYTGLEISPRPVPDSTGEVELEPLPDSRSLAPDQATQLVSALRLAYCQPHVEGFFNFLLWDEERLEGWQSAPFWYDRTPKGSFDALRGAIEEVTNREVDCAELNAASREEATAVPAETTDGPGETTAGPRGTTAGPGETTVDPDGTAAPPDEESDDGTFSASTLAAGAAGAILLAGAGLLYVLRRRRGGGSDGSR
jgi:hypothetical protein